MDVRFASTRPRRLDSSRKLPVFDEDEGWYVSIAASFRKPDYPHRGPLSIRVSAYVVLRSGQERIGSNAGDNRLGVDRRGQNRDISTLKLIRIVQRGFCC